FRRGLEVLILDFQDIADLIHEEADGAVVVAYYDVHREVCRGTWMQAQTTSQVNRRDDLSTQVDEAVDGRGRQGDASHYLIADDLLNFLHFPSKEEPVNYECRKLFFPCHNLFPVYTAADSSKKSGSAVW